MLDRMGFDDSEPIEHPMVTRSIERAQKRVEDRNFAIRKQLLQFDDVLSRQREVIYAQRRLILLGKDEEVKEAAIGMVEETVASLAENFLNPEVHPEDWDPRASRPPSWTPRPSFRTSPLRSLGP